ncbi:MAG TPA: hypothetical protein VNO26_08425 [Candidatus Limnocylindria bacterium]|nr:hypothetical protein [Candidatus Limnocylindria bacterium]
MYQLQPPGASRPRPCSYDGITYSTGSASCQGGTQYRCEDGTWRSIDRPCTVMGANTVKIDPDGDTCLYEGAALATGSTICKTETTFFCNHGQWVNLGPVCR